MSNKILMVDGYDYDGWKSLSDCDCIDAFKHYSETLKSISSSPLEIITIHPGKKEEFLPQGISLEDFDGIVWTGSSLNIYDSNPAIMRQIELAKETLKINTNIFGSCWGLQVYVTAAGGSVRKNPKGREMIIARNIQLNENGKKHYMYKGKYEKFDALCSHLDEVENIPSDSKILCSNDHSEIQALSFKINGANFCGTQYHPEFNFEILSKILLARKSILISENIFEDNDNANKTISCLDNLTNNNGNGDYLKIGQDILDKRIRNKELENWLNYIQN